MHAKGLVRKEKSKLKGLSKLLVLIGALNWGLVGLLNFDLVATLFGKKSIISKLVYIFVGLSGVYLITIYKEKYSYLKKHWRPGEKKYSGKQYSWSGIP
ncbi:DUF378 domain-containing protein [Methanosarcina horonobensis HB-1 = JCM 15518]|uniref:DUF378 domain-containing protein n=1 Tax=Methanosarcina horonobensis HB-1 = JCM 15518 TaxID=1434110 RepID=A0A0E3SI36_9EURY|nr:DUF378 domain-containing protein [Methanosarcina horonobensis]AKB79573.1 DUF378 domain-containing protein [Methanosarcina horonobensis HB-1 = JCM 15518]